MVGGKKHAGREPDGQVEYKWKAVHAWWRLRVVCPVCQWEVEVNDFLAGLELDRLGVVAGCLRVELYLLLPV